MRQITMIGLIAMLFPAAAFGQMECYDLDENPVRVIAHKFEDSPPAYAFRIVNGSDRPIRSIDLGYGYEWFLSIEAWRQMSISAPAGWEGERRHCEGFDHCGHFRYYWKALDSESEIPPDESLMGFGVDFRWGSELNSTAVEELSYIDRQWDLRTMPFTAYSYSPDSACYIGIVEESAGSPPIAGDAMRPPEYVISSEAARSGCPGCSR